jgi:hypothetical protein
MPGYALHLRLRCRTAIGVQNGGAARRAEGNPQLSGPPRNLTHEARTVPAAPMPQELDAPVGRQGGAPGSVTAARKERCAAW